MTIAIFGGKFGAGFSMLVAADDAAFAALSSGTAPPPLGLVAEGLETPEILAMLRRRAMEVGRVILPAAWLIVESGIVVGLCSLMDPPDAAGSVEIGYGIATGHRGRGIGRRAIGDLVAWAERQDRIHALTAATAPDNLASRRVLEANGFVRTGEIEDPKEGRLIAWQREFRR